MKTKFKKSNIYITGTISVGISGEGDKGSIIVNGSKGKTKSGIYCLRNKLYPERYYIGMARNLETRYQHHISDLQLGKHKSKLMQKDLEDNWQYGATEMFEMEVIIYCRPSELTFYENILINNLHPYYNTHKDNSKPETLYPDNSISNEDLLQVLGEKVYESTEEVKKYLESET